MIYISVYQHVENNKINYRKFHLLINKLIFLPAENTFFFVIQRFLKRK